MVMIHKNLGEAGVVIAALKVSNQERQMIIDELITEGEEKDRYIEELRRQIEALKEVAAKKEEISHKMYRIFR